MKGRVDMQSEQFKKGLVGMACVLTMIFSIGAILSITAQASTTNYQYRDRDGDRYRYRERHRDRYYDRYRDRRPDAYQYNSADVQKGYRDGLNRGREDAETNRTPDPNNSEHYRHGNGGYRQGFAKGYARSYRDYSQGYRR